MAEDWTQAFRKVGWDPGAAASGVGSAVSGATRGAASAAGSAVGDWTKAWGDRFVIPPALPASPTPRSGGAPGTPSQGVAAYYDLIKDAAGRHGVDPTLLAGVVDFESSGNPAAVNRSSGATGLGQVMPRERGFGDRPTGAELLDPATNLDWSARILKSGIDRYGTEDQGLAAYLGAIDARGNITGAVDANGTGGNQYIRTVRDRQQRYRTLGGLRGGAGSPSGAGTPENALTSGEDWTSAFRQAGWSPEERTTPIGWDAPGSPREARPQQTGDAPGWLQLAQTQLGKPYIWGSGSGAGGRGTGDINRTTGQPNGFDCSGYVSWVYKNALGVDLPAYTGSAYPATQGIRPEEARAGDLVFYNMNTSDPRKQHVAIYLGDGRVIQSGGAGDGVNIAPVTQIGNLEFRRSPQAAAALARGQGTVGSDLTSTAAPAGPLYLQGTVTPSEGGGGDGWEQGFLAAGWRP